MKRRTSPRIRPDLRLVPKLDPLEVRLAPAVTGPLVGSAKLLATDPTSPVNLPTVSAQQAAAGTDQSPPATPMMGPSVDPSAGQAGDEAADQQQQDTSGQDQSGGQEQSDQQQPQGFLGSAHAARATAEANAAPTDENRPVLYADTPEQATFI